LIKYYRFNVLKFCFIVPPKKNRNFDSENFYYHFENWKEEQKLLFENSGNNLELNFEFRCQVEHHGYLFHDRFIIFPDDLNKPQVWSLGTSVNSFGKGHHILQKVSNPIIIQKAFEQLWDELEEPICLVWKSK